MQELKNMYMITLKMDSGVVGRKSFWLAILQLVFALIIVAICYTGAVLGLTNAGIDLTFNGMVYSGKDIINTIVVVPAVFMLLWTWIAVVSLQVQRIRDLGVSGWWFGVSIVISLIPFLGLLAIIPFLMATDCLKGSTLSPQARADEAQKQRDHEIELVKLTNALEK